MAFNTSAVSCWNRLRAVTSWLNSSMTEWLSVHFHSNVIRAWGVKRAYMPRQSSQAGHPANASGVPGVCEKGEWDVGRNCRKDRLGKQENCTNTQTLKRSGGLQRWRAKRVMGVLSVSGISHGHTGHVRFLASVEWSGEVAAPARYRHARGSTKGKEKAQVKVSVTMETDCTYAGMLKLTHYWETIPFVFPVLYSRSSTLCNAHVNCPLMDNPGQEAGDGVSEHCFGPFPQN